MGDDASPYRNSPFDSLKLLVRIGEDFPHPSSLSIRLDGGLDKDERHDFHSSVLLAGGGLIIISTCLPDGRNSKSYIVYDAAKASLAMIFALPMRY
uniref:Uncharacterized protein n=1 Tax=Leersia perrieri TaxID=77586 RepID=A0A0D9VYF7_9ORYZ